MSKAQVPPGLVHLQLIDLVTLAVLLGRSQETIKSDLRRAPWRLPPPIPARDWARPMWLAGAVEEWIASPPPGRLGGGKRGKGKVRRQQAD